MENNQFPEREDLLPEEMEQETPAVEALTFAPLPADGEALPVVEELPVDDGETPAEAAIDTVEALPPVEDTPEISLPETQDVPDGEIPEAETPAPARPDFMDRIPDVDADYPEEPEKEDEELSELMDIVNDPQFAASQTQEQPADEILDEEYRDPAPAKPADQEKPSFQPWVTRKGRPKRKKGEGLFGIPNILVTGVWLALIVMIGVTLGRMLWVCAADVLAFGREDRAVTITVYEADTMEDIVDKLHANGLIRYKSLFNLYASISDAEEEIKPGIYDLNTRYDYHALVNFMSPSSTRSVVELTIPEGYTCRQIFALLEENRVCTALDIAAYAADGALSDYWFLTDVERGSEYCLEGYLFPDTYQFYKNSTPREALEKMLDNFDYRFSEEMRYQIDSLNANVTGGGFTLKDVVTVASLIEKESAHPTESDSISGVIYNRLYNWDYPAFLNIDAAIVYAQGGDADVIDTGLDSPYNTYLYTGLTPTPISNPGLSSLQAAVNPESHNYYYYVLNPATGRHQFSTTQDEHNAWINEFYG